MKEKEVKEKEVKEKEVKEKEVKVKEVKILREEGKKGKWYSHIASRRSCSGDQQCTASCSHSVLVPDSDSNYNPYPLGIAKISWSLPPNKSRDSIARHLP